MSIAIKMQNQVDQLRTLLQRGNGDLLQCAPGILDSLDLEIERVRGLEQVAPINNELAAAMAKGERHEHCHA